MNVHLIAIGGSAMHNMAIAMHKKGFIVTGSDDEIFEPSKSRLAKLNLLPVKEGWDINNIHKGLDAVILGMHARADNPELLKAQELGYLIARSDADFMRVAVVTPFEFINDCAFPWSVYPNCTQAYASLKARMVN